MKTMLQFSFTVPHQFNTLKARLCLIMYVCFDHECAECSIKYFDFK